MTIYSVSAAVSNGTDTLFFDVDLAELAVGTYTKASNGSDATISVQDNLGNFYNTLGFITSEDEGLTDYTINITDVSENTISGTFNATLYDFINDTDAEASGSFMAIDLAAVFNFN